MTPEADKEKHASPKLERQGVWGFLTDHETEELAFDEDQLRTTAQVYAGMADEASSHDDPDAEPLSAVNAEHPSEERDAGGRRVFLVGIAGPSGVGKARWPASWPTS